MDNYQIPNQQVIRMAKEAIINDQPYVNNDVPQYIMESWLRSKQSGLNPKNKVFPKQTRDLTTLSKVTDYTKYSRYRIGEYYDAKHALLEQIGAAILYLDPNLSVFSKDGSARLLAELKEKNIKFGSNFSEPLIGTNAASLAQKMDRAIWVFGEEHYLKALSDYICIAQPFYYELQNAYYYLMIVIPLSNYNSTSAAIINFIFEADKANIGLYELPEVTITNEILKLHLQQNNSISIMVDVNGIIVYVNNQFQNVFNKNLNSVGGKHLSTVLPEIGFATNCLKTGKSISLHEVIFPNLSTSQNSYFMECIPVNKNNEYIGLAITLTNAVYLKKHIDIINRKNAYFTFDDIIGKNQNFVYIKEMASQAANIPSNVLILGESGTGKELFAQAIHNAGNRRIQPFIPVNCAAIPKELIGSELFGYEEGAFTGAKKGGAPGKFELADGGTLFLDEIADMPLDMQAVLLRVLEDRMVTRIGGSKPTKINVRLIAATNQNLWEYVNEGKFRLDLYFRLNVVKIDLPPLRKRMDDLELLVNHFIKLLSASFNKNIDSVAPEVLNLFYDYSWPGNIRQLRNVMERCIYQAQSKVITIADVPPDVRKTLENDSKRFNTLPATVGDSMEIPNYDEYARNKLKILMLKHNGNKSAVAAELGISRNTLYKRLKNLY